MKTGTCELCARVTPLTFHHLVPKSQHRRTWCRKRFTREERERGIAICRPCHNGIHALYSEKELARSLNSLDLLLDDEAIRRHVAWVAKQKIRV